MGLLYDKNLFTKVKEQFNHLSFYSYWNDNIVFDFNGKNIILFRKRTLFKLLLFNISINWSFTICHLFLFCIICNICK